MCTCPVCHYCCTFCCCHCTTKGYPGEVRNLSSSILPNNSIWLQWDAPSNVLEESIDYYVLSFSVESNVTALQTANNFYVLNNISSKEYNFSVLAVNCYGEGTPVYTHVAVSNSPISIVAVVGGFFGVIVVLVLTIACISIAIGKHLGNVQVSGFSYTMTICDYYIYISFLMQEIKLKVK